MKVAVAYEVGQPLVPEDLSMPEVGAGDVLVRIAARGICHTDLTVIDGQSPLPLPIVPGHCGSAPDCTTSTPWSAATRSRGA